MLTRAAANRRRALLVGLCLATLPASACGAEAETSAAPEVASPTTILTDAPSTLPTTTTSEADPDGDGCLHDEVALTEWVTVADIPAGDPDGGLVVRDRPSAGAAALIVLVEGTEVLVLPQVDTTGCVRLDSGAVWWAVWITDTESGWANSRYLDDDRGLDDEPGLEDDSMADGIGEAEQDVHGDCVLFTSAPDECVGVYIGSGGITALMEPDAVVVEFAQVDCVYLRATDACRVLELLGWGAEDDHGLGNSMSQAPIDEIAADCEALGPSDPIGALACAELATR